MHISRLPVPIQPHNPTMVPTAAPGNGHPPQTCTACRGFRPGFPSAVFGGSPESEIAGVHTQRRHRHSNLGGPHREPGQPSQVLHKSKLALSGSKISALRKGQAFCRRLGQEGAKAASTKRWARKASTIQGEMPQFLLSGILCLE